MFNVTYEIYTQDSLKYGDSAESGFIAESVCLREAIRLLFQTESSHCSLSSVEPNEWPVIAPRWITAHNSANFLTGDIENRSLHFPENLTPSTRRRIARLIDAI